MENPFLYLLNRLLEEKRCHQQNCGCIGSYNNQGEKVMLKKLYKKSELWFALGWIVAYVVLASTGDHLSADLGIDKIVTLPILIAMSTILYVFVRKMA